MRTLATALTLIAALAVATPATANDSQQVRWHLRDVGVDRVTSISCDDQRNCTARYAYIDKAALAVGLRQVAVDRCRGWFVVSDGVEDLGDGFEFDYTEVTQNRERCGYQPRHYMRTAR